MSRPLRHVLAALLACAPLAVAACGGGDDKPGYCADRSQLQSSIEDLTNISPSQGLSGLESKLRAIQSDANALVASAQSAFSDETSAIERSVDALVADVRALPSSPSAAQVGALATSASSVVSAVGNFMDATQSECD